MINVLIVEDDFHYSKSLINLLSDINSNIKIYKITDDGEEAMRIINDKTNNIDIVLLDLKLPHYTGIEILKYIESNNLIQYKESFIVLSAQIESIVEVRNSPYLYTYLDKMSGFHKILQEINNLVEIKEREKNSIEYRIRSQLKELHYNFSYNGTIYLMEAIMLLYNKDNFENVRIEREIYSQISKKYKKSINNIKTNIIHATDLMFYDCETNIIKKYFGLYDNEKPTPKVIMFTIINNLKYNL